MSVLIHERSGRRTIYSPDDRHLQGSLGREPVHFVFCSGQIFRAWQELSSARRL